MNKLTISKENYSKIIELQNNLTVNNIENIKLTTGENIMLAKYTLEDIAEKIQTLQEAIYDFETAIFDKDVDEMVAKMTEYTRLISELKQDVDETQDYIAGSVSGFEQTVIPSEFTVIVSEEEIKSEIESSFDESKVMSIGFNDGEFALLFGEDEESIDLHPFIFAKGKQEDYDEARKFIEQFLDMEEDF